MIDASCLSGVSLSLTPKSPSGELKEDQNFVKTTSNPVFPGKQGLTVFKGTPVSILTRQMINITFFSRVTSLLSKLNYKFSF